MKTTLKGPRGRLFFGSAADFKRDQLGFYVSCAREYGDWVETWLGPFRMWLVYHPDAIEEILVTRSRDFAKSSGLLRLRPLGGNGLFLAEGDSWLRQRRLLQPAFHRQRLAGYGEVMVAFARRHTADWKDGRVVEMQSEMMALTQAIVAKTLFDADMSGDAYEAGQAAEMVTRDFGDRLQRLLVPAYWLPTPRNLKLRRAIKRLDRLVYRIIEERRSSPRDRGDLLSMLVEAQDADDGSCMTVQQVRDEVMTLFMAGHETTATSLTWTWYLLAQHPEVEARLVDELAAVLEDRAPAVSDLPRLRYADMIVTEAMRLYPPAYGLGRQAVKPTEIAGHPVAKGDILIVGTYVVQRDARWFEEPESFRPERWEGDLARRLPRFAYFPFGGGPRQCIGNGFAQMEAVLILATVAQRFRLSLVPGQRITPTPYVTLRPEPGIRLLVAGR